MTSQLDLDSLMEFGDTTGLYIWMNDHAARHILFAQNLQSRYSFQSPLFDIGDPECAKEWALAMQQKQDGQMTPRITAWLQAHQAVHLAELVTIGGGEPPDLVTVDFRDADQFYNWMSNHISLHDIEDEALG